MRHQNRIFHCLLKHIPRSRFQPIVDRYCGDKHIRSLDCWSQMGALIYAQLSGSRSLRDVEGALASHHHQTHHLGIGRVRRSTLADANAARAPEIFEEVFSLLLDKLQGLRGGAKEEMCAVLRLIDATPIKLGLDCKDWAQFSSRYVGAKAHFIYDPDADIPVYFSVTKGNVNDITAAKQMPIEPGATYVFDKGYYDFGWWAELTRQNCTFVTRLKKNTRGDLIKDLEPVGENIVLDRIIRFTKRMAGSRKNPYLKPLREIVVRRDNGEELRLVTNDCTSPASQIAALYKRRWAIELFFKWIKQNLKIRKFLGTSENAIRIQIIVAMIAYLLIALVRQMLPGNLNMTRLTRLIAANLMQRKSFKQMLMPPPKYPPPALATPQMQMAL